ncbi:MAG: N-acetylmuramoyl-L-alanine amidase [Actinomycetota bacterium]
MSVGPDLYDRLVAEGLNVRAVEGWRSRRTRGPFEPAGIMLHDTVRPECKELIVNGRPGISGPLANLLIAKDGSVDLVAGSRCHHAGNGAQEVLEEVTRGLEPGGDASARGLRDCVMGNSYFYGIEVDNRSDGADPYPEVQIEALVSCCVAFRKMHPEWQGFREIHHRQWTARKQDMSCRIDIPALVAARLKA